MSLLAVQLGDAAQMLQGMVPGLYVSNSNSGRPVDGILHYAVANIPGAVPRTSTLALTNATLPYAIKLADMGWKEVCKKDPGLADGVNIVDGKITFKAVAETFDMPYTPFNL